MRLPISEELLLNISIASFFIVGNTGCNVVATFVGSYLLRVPDIWKYHISEAILISVYYSLLEIPISICLYTASEAIDINEKLEKVLGSRLLSPIFYLFNFSGVKFVLSPYIGNYSLENMDIIKNMTSRILGKDLEIRLTDYTAVSSCGWAATVSSVVAIASLVVIFSPKATKVSRR